VKGRRGRDGRESRRCVGRVEQTHNTVALSNHPDHINAFWKCVSASIHEQNEEFATE